MSPSWRAAADATARFLCTRSPVASPTETSFSSASKLSTRSCPSPAFFRETPAAINCPSTWTVSTIIGPTFYRLLPTCDSAVDRALLHLNEVEIGSRVAGIVRELERRASGDRQRHGLRRVRRVPAMRAVEGDALALRAIHVQRELSGS